MSNYENLNEEDLNEENILELAKEQVLTDSYLQKMDKLTVLLTGYHMLEVPIDEIVEFNIKLHEQVERIIELENELSGKTKEEIENEEQQEIDEEDLEYDSENIPNKEDDEKKLDELLNKSEDFWKLFKERYGEDSIYSKAIGE